MAYSRFTDKHIHGMDGSVVLYDYFLRQHFGRYGGFFPLLIVLHRWRRIESVRDTQHVRITKLSWLLYLPPCS